MREAFEAEALEVGAMAADHSALAEDLFGGGGSGGSADAGGGGGGGGGGGKDGDGLAALDFLRAVVVLPEDVLGCAGGGGGSTEGGAGSGSLGPACCMVLPTSLASVARGPASVAEGPALPGGGPASPASQASAGGESGESGGSGNRARGRSGSGGTGDAMLGSEVAALTWLGLRAAPTFPEGVVAALREAGDAASHVYTRTEVTPTTASAGDDGGGGYAELKVPTPVVHVAEPDFREGKGPYKRKAVAEADAEVVLALTYGHVLKALASLLAAPGRDRPKVTSVRLAPLSCGGGRCGSLGGTLLSGGLTWRAMEQAFAGLAPSERVLVGKVAFYFCVGGLDGPAAAGDGNDEAVDGEEDPAAAAFAAAAAAAKEGLERSFPQEHYDALLWCRSLALAHHGALGQRLGVSQSLEAVVEVDEALDPLGLPEGSVVVADVHGLANARVHHWGGPRDATGTSLATYRWLGITGEDLGAGVAAGDPGAFPPDVVRFAEAAAAAHDDAEAKAKEAKAKARAASRHLSNYRLLVGGGGGGGRGGDGSFHRPGDAKAHVYEIMPRRKPPTAAVAAAERAAAEAPMLAAATAAAERKAARAAAQLAAFFEEEGVGAGVAGKVGSLGVDSLADLEALVLGAKSDPVTELGLVGIKEDDVLTLAGAVAERVAAREAKGGPPAGQPEPEDDEVEAEEEAIAAEAEAAAAAAAAERAAAAEAAASVPVRVCVIHGGGVDARRDHDAHYDAPLTRQEFRDHLANAYRGILAAFADAVAPGNASAGHEEMRKTSFFAALAATIEAKDGGGDGSVDLGGGGGVGLALSSAVTELRLPPVSGGAWAGPFLAEMPHLTFEALAAGFAMLRPRQQAAVAASKVTLCLAGAGDLAAFASAGFAGAAVGAGRDGSSVAARAAARASATSTRWGAVRKDVRNAVTHKE